MALQRICSRPGCDELTVGSGSRCELHVQARDAARGSAAERGYDREWQRIRKVVLARDEYRCLIRLPGCTDEATTVDHIVPLSAGGARLDPDNLQSACRHCNTAKGGRLHRRPAWARGKR